MIGEHGGERGLVFRLEQGFHRASRQLGESGVGGGEHGERALALQRFNQAGGLYGGNQCGVISRVHGIIDDVLGGQHRGAAHDRLCADHGGQAGRGNGKQRSAQGSVGTHEILHLVDQVPPE